MKAWRAGFLVDTLSSSTVVNALQWMGTADDECKEASPKRVVNEDSQATQKTEASLEHRIQVYPVER